MTDIIKNILFVAYIIIAITVTVLLLSYNDFMYSEIGGYTLFIVKNNELEPDYKQGDLLIIKNSSATKVKVDDEIVTYREYGTDDYTLYMGTLNDKIKQGTHTVLTVNNASQIDATYLIGKTEDIKIIPNLGAILGILESRWGYLFSIVIVTLLLLLQELYDLFLEIKYGNEKEAKGSK